MQNLIVIENDLVPVYETSTGEKVVYGTELHAILGVKSNYREWINRRIGDIDATENDDYEGVEISTASGQNRKEHIIRLDIAKEMAMLERNEKGKQVRRYFINIEKKYKEQPRPKTAIELLKLQTQAIIEVNEKIDSVKQDLETFKQDMPLLAVECDKITAAVRKRGVDALGGSESNAYKESSLHNKVFQDIYRELKRQFGVSTYKAIKRNQCEHAISIIEAYVLPLVLQERIDNCNAQLCIDAL